MFEQLSNFHFLRPAWLLIIVAAVVLYWLVWRRENLRASWGKVVAPHLLEHLLVGKKQRWRLRPVHLACWLIFFSGFALAGPTWQREVPPFSEDKAPMIIALDLSQTMNAIDVQPSRLKRAKQKIRDLLRQRPGAKNALLVYAGTAHMVLPFAEDPAVMELFLSPLESWLMPQDGSEAALALEAAKKLLTNEEIPGTILFITDGIERKDFTAFSDFKNSEQDQIMVLGIGTSAGGPIKLNNKRFLTDRSGRRVISRMEVAELQALGDETGVPVSTVSLNDDDVKWVQRKAQSHLQIVQQEQAQTRWRDFGYYLIYPISLLALLWFRRGWTIRWASVLLFFIVVDYDPPLFAQSQTALEGDTSNVISTEEDSLFSTPVSITLWEQFLSLWLTADQEGRYYFERGNYALAARRFEDPTWKGISSYYAQNYEDAIDQFALSNNIESHFYLGNCYARSERYEEAVASYDQALTEQQDFPEALANREIVLALIKEQEEDEEEYEQGEPNLDPDEIKFDEKGEKGKKGKMRVMKVGQEEMAELWMRNIQTSPAEFLRVKFILQAEESSNE